MQSLQVLADKSAGNNAKVGITGLLLYGSGHYFQVLEGNFAAIRAVYDRIRKDKQHKACQLLCQCERTERLFPSWNMGQVNLESPSIVGKSDWDVISSALANGGASRWKDTDPVINWIRQFVEHHRDTAASSAA